MADLPTAPGPRIRKLQRQRVAFDKAKLRHRGQRKNPVGFGKQRRQRVDLRPLPSAEIEIEFSAAIPGDGDIGSDHAQRFHPDPPGQQLGPVKQQMSLRQGQQSPPAGLQQPQIVQLQLRRPVGIQRHLDRTHRNRAFGQHALQRVVQPVFHFGDRPDRQSDGFAGHAKSGDDQAKRKQQQKQPRAQTTATATRRDGSGAFGGIWLGRFRRVRVIGLRVQGRGQHLRLD